MAEHEPRYRLAPVRDASARRETEKRGDLAAAVGDARVSEDAVRAVADREQAARDALALARGGRAALLAAGSPAHVLALAQRFVERRLRDLETTIADHHRARAAHAGKLEQIDAARDRLVRARAEREVIERHFARWRETQRKLADRRED